MKTLRAIAIALLVVASPAIASASEEKACEGTFSLASPLPDQCLGVIDTDRPHQTDTPHVVPAGHVQFESAIASLQIGAVDAPTTPNAHVVLFDDAYKFGLFSSVDLQLLFKHADYVPAEKKLAPPGPLGVRLKWNVVEEKGWRPAITLVPWVFVPFDPSQTFHAGPLVFWGWELPYRFELEMNAGVLVYSRGSPTVRPVVASALTKTIVGEFRVFIDIYATGRDVALGTGALLAVSRDAQIDLGTYVGLHGDEPRATPFVGFSIRR